MIWKRLWYKVMKSCLKQEQGQKLDFFLQQVETCKKLEGDEDEYR